MAGENANVGGFELRNCVATGATTQIWEACEVGSSVQVAMKLLLPEAHKSSEIKAVLKHEFKVGSSMHHPAFLRFHRIEVNRDHGFFTMDFYRSPSLKTQIATNRASVQSCFRKLGEELALAFQYMHDQGWLHRDIKPDNILVNRAGEARIIDFSLSSRVLGSIGKMFAKQKTIQGTRTYIAPETILKKPPTVQTDIYSLGITFYEVLTGNPPFAGTSPSDLLKKHLTEPPVEPSALNPNVTPELDKVILKMLEKKPENRYKTMQEIASAFRTTNCFKEDPLQLYEKEMKEAEEARKTSVDKRLDSRADAERTAAGITTPLKQKSKRKVSPAMLREEEERRAKAKGRGGKPDSTAQPAAQPQQPAMPGMMPPGMYPGMMPGMMPPGMGYPGMVPGQMPPGMAPGQMPPGMMPGQIAPGQMPPGMMPGMPPGYPGAVPGQMPPTAAPPQQPGTQPMNAPAQPQTPQQAPAGAQPPAGQPAAPANTAPAQPEQPPATPPADGYSGAAGGRTLATPTGTHNPIAEVTKESEELKAADADDLDRFLSGE